MSAGRFEWEATRFEYRDEATGAWLVVRLMDGGTWSWKVDGVSIPHIDGVGVTSSPSAAKGCARKALEAFKAKRVSP